jgi:hypothetical protein
MRPRSPLKPSGFVAGVRPRALVAVVGLILILVSGVVPAELWTGSECAMACSLTDRCCCRGGFWAADGLPVLAEPTVSSPANRCPPGCASAGGASLVLPRYLARSFHGAVVIPALGVVEHRDPPATAGPAAELPTLPRPPPSSLT